MKANIGNRLVNKLTAKPKRYDVWDNKLTGFHIRVFPSGKQTYRVLYKRGNVVTIGSTELYTLPEAREKAKMILGELPRGCILIATNRRVKYLL